MLRPHCSYLPSLQKPVRIQLICIFRVAPSELFRPKSYIKLYELTQKLYMFSDFPAFSQTWGQFLGCGTIFQLDET